MFLLEHRPDCMAVIARLRSFRTSLQKPEIAVWGSVCTQDEILDACNQDEYMSRLWKPSALAFAHLKPELLMERARRYLLRLDTKGPRGFG